MNINDYRLKDANLYLVANPENFDTEDDFLDAVAKELQKGVNILELKTESSSPSKVLKYGKKLRELCSIYNTIFIIESRADIGHILQTDGIRLEQDDIDIDSARHLLGPQSIVGFSVSSLNDLKSAISQKCDFIILISETSDEIFEEIGDIVIPIFYSNKEKSTARRLIFLK